MKTDRFVGHTMEEMVEIHNCNSFEGFTVFRLQSDDDTIGTRIADDYTIRSLLQRVPSLKRCYIWQAEDYYGTIILRVRNKPKAGRKGGQIAEKH